ncbi:MAG: redoxin domain-containing protein [Phycisphaeraceae bacterium]|nr:redoxin domain-containing protein [Phycisphaeraceae bacterium]
MKKLAASLTAALCLVAALSLGMLVGQQEALAAENAAPIGKAAPAFALPDVVTGNDVTLESHKGKVVVIMFHSINCPYYKMHADKGYDRVFVPMVESYKDKDVVFVGINANKNESTDKIKAYAEKHKINYTVLKDKGNKVADAYGAKVTPHVMVIDQEGKLRYRGGVEKASRNPADCGTSDTQYLGPVIDALLDGSEPPETETNPVGCGIKKV